MKFNFGLVRSGRLALRLRIVLKTSIRDADCPAKFHGQHGLIILQLSFGNPPPPHELVQIGRAHV